MAKFIQYGTLRINTLEIAAYSEYYGEKSAVIAIHLKSGECFGIEEKKEVIKDIAENLDRKQQILEFKPSGFGGWRQMGQLSRMEMMPSRQPAPEPEDETEEVLQ